MTPTELPTAANLPARCDLNLARQLYDIESVAHPFVESWKPKVVGRGGEHIVYRSEAKPELVLKVNVDLLEKAISSASEETSDKIRNYIETTNRRYAKMVEYFSSCVVPKQTIECLEVPVTAGMLHWQFRGNLPLSTPSSVLAAVTKQEYLPALARGELLTIVSGYSEKRSTDLDALQRMNLLLKCNLPAEEAIAIFRSTQMSPDLGVVLEKATDCPELKSALTNFIRDSCNYVLATAETLDLAGGGNVVFSEQEGNWYCYLADALYPSKERMFARTKDAVAKIILGDSLDDAEANILMNGLNFVRTINGLAYALDLPERLDVAPPDATIEEFDFITPIRLTQLDKSDEC